MDGAIFSAQSDGIEYIKFIGTVRYSHCAGLESHIDTMFEQSSFDDVVIDLEEAVILDSTALGLLAKVAIELKKYSNKKPVIFLHSGELASVIKRVCFDQVFTIVLDKNHLSNLSFNKISSQKNDLHAINQQKNGDEKTLERVINAHRYLAELDKKNQSLYQEITAAFKR